MSKNELLIAGAGCIAAFTAGYVISTNKQTLSLLVPSNSTELAAWVGAIGAVGAVVAAIWIMDRQHSLSEQRLRDERAHFAAKEAQERRDRLINCLTVASFTAAGTITSLEMLKLEDDENIPRTVHNQIAFMARMAEPSLRIPLHELGSFEAVRGLHTVTDLAQRLSESLAAWNRLFALSALDISDVRNTVATLEPEAERSFDVIKGLIQIHTAP